MILELGTGAVLGSIFLAAKTKGKGVVSNDHQKIKEIADQCNLKTKNQSIRIHRKTKKEKYTEYVYQIPLGLSLNDFLAHIDAFNDGLNNKTKVKTIELKNWKHIKFKKMKGKSPKEIVQYLRAILTDFYIPRKTVEMKYDGMLKMKVYEADIPSMLLFHQDSWKGCPSWHIPLGEDKDGMYYMRLDDGHTVVAGTTRYGKTTFIHLLVNTFLFLHPEEVEFSLIDLKSGLAFQRYYDCVQVRYTAETLEEAHKCFENVIADMDHRKQVFKRMGIEKIQEDKTNTFKRHYVVIDEASNLDWQRSRNLKDADAIKHAKNLYNQTIAWMKQVACEAAGLGIYLVFSTQYPTAEILDSQVKANTINKVCFRLDTAVQSKVVLDESGAEEITHKGRAIVRTPDGTRMIQTNLMTPRLIEKNLEPHIIFRPRKDEEFEDSHQDAGESGVNTLEFEETWIH